MGLNTAIAAVGAFVLAALLTSGVRRLALASGMLDVPNARSSHVTITPRGGGIAMFLAAAASWLVLAFLGEIPRKLLIALLGGGSAVALVGLVDDRRPVPAIVRLLVHFGAAIWALAWLGAPVVLRLGAHSVLLGWSGGVLAALGITWFLNLFNFMDGIDGIAASEAAFIACAGAALSLLGGGTAAIAAAAVLLGAACCGFLIWNWPPARIFMGDVGSGYLGYSIGVLALAATMENPAAAWAWLILGGIFFVDATVTLTRRLLRGERTYEAHRTHAYQWLARRWSSHRKVTIGVLAVNVFWLLPCACLAVLRPTLSGWMVLVALVPLVVVALASGAGRRETA